MKILRLLTSVGLLGFILLGVFSCKKDSVEDPYQGRLIRVKHYFSIQDTIVRAIQEYQYDSKNRLKAIESEGSTVKYEYNANNQLIGKYYIQSNPDFNDTITYIYKDGKLVVELQPSNRANSTYFKIIKTTYEYEDEKLVKRKIYRDSLFQELRVFEYKDNLLKKESVYYDSLGIDLHYITNHHYDDHNKLAVSSKAYATATYMAWFQSIYYFYNEHGDLDLEYSEQSDQISAGITYCRRYEYY